MNQRSYTTIITKALTIKSFLLGWGMVLFFVILNSYGALVLKSQVQKLEEWSFSSARSYFSFFVTLFSFWQTWMGLGFVCIAMGAWMIALTHLELSKAYPVAIALNLLIIVGLSFIYFHESLTLSKIIGVFLILTGVVVVFR